MNLRLPTILVSAAAMMSGCMQGPGFFSQSSSESSNRTKKKTDTAETVVVEGNDVVVAKIEDLTKMHALQAGAETEIAGSSINFPPGALAVSTEVTLQAGASIVTDMMAAELAMAGGTGMSAASGAVMITAAGNIAITQPFAISIALPQNSLHLTDERYANLIVVYKTMIPGSSDYRQGILLRKDFDVADGLVTFKAQELGVFQAAYTTVVQSVAVSEVTKSGIMSKKEEVAAPTPKWQVIRNSADGAASATFDLSLTDFGKIADCAAIVDADKAEPWDRRLRVGVKASVERLVDVAHVVYVRFNCRELTGRESGFSDWMMVSFPAAVQVDRTPPQNVSILINNGDEWTRSESVGLSFQSDDATEVYVTNDKSCAKGGAWELLADRKTWQLSSRQGEVAVYATFRDAAGNRSVCVSDTIKHDSLPPVDLSVVINDEASYTRLPKVSLVLNATGANEMALFEDSACAGAVAWIPYSSSFEFTLTRLNTKTGVYARFRDPAGNSSVCVGSAITHDNTAPLSPGKPSAPGRVNPGDSINFTWAANPGDSDIAEYQFSAGTDAACSNIYNGRVGKVTSWNITSAVMGSTYCAKVQAVDQAGNVGAFSSNSEPVKVGPGPQVLTVNLSNLAAGSVINASIKNETKNIVGATGNGTMQYAIAAPNATCNESLAYSGVAYASHIQSDGVYKICVQATLDGEYAYGQSSHFTRDTTPPVALVSSSPESVPSNATSLNLTVAGADVLHYKHKIGGSIDCGALSGYSASWIPAETKITDAVYAMPNGIIKVCVLGKDAAGNEQLASQASVLTFWRGEPDVFSIHAVNNSGRRPTISWSTSNGRDLFHLTVAPLSGGTDCSSNAYFSTTTTQYSYKFVSDLPDGTYKVCIKAQNASGYRYASNSGTLTFTVSGSAGASGAWTSLPQASAPSVRSGASGVYLNSQFVVFGGSDGGQEMKSDGAYFNGSSWGSIGSLGHGFVGAGVVATENAIYAHGGQVSQEGYIADTFSSYYTATKTWNGLTSDSIQRTQHVAAYVGGKIILFGGRNGSVAMQYGRIYDIGTSTWDNLNSDNQPSARYGANSVVIGSKLIVWGGQGDMDLSSTIRRDGAMYDTGSNTWITMSVDGSPYKRMHASVISTGTKMIVWGGKSEGGAALADGAIFDPDDNTWRPLTVNGGTPPNPRFGHIAVWSGAEMIVWGGQDASAYFNNGGLYHPESGTWTPIASTGAPSPRAGAAYAWSGSALYIFGGINGSGYLGDFYKFTP